MKFESFIRLGLILSVIHLGIVFLCSLFSFSIAMDNVYNNPNQSKLPSGVSAAQLSDILSIPGSMVKDYYPDAEFVVVFLNSVVWGFGIAGPATIFKKRTRSMKRNFGSDEYQEKPDPNPPSVDNLSDSSTEPANLVKRLWRGDIPLGRTFWFYGVLGNLAVAWIGLLAVMQFSSYSYHFIKVYYILSAIVVIYSILTLVFTWRSAGKYAGSKILAVLAKLGIVIGLIYHLELFFSN